MLKAFSTAATGMHAQQTMVDNVANNLANMNTNGFKRSQVNFHDLLYLKIRESGREEASGVIAPSGLEIGSGVKIASTNRIFTVGELVSTGGDLDVAIQGDGFFEITDANGNLKYTRDGAFQLDANGQIVTSHGLIISPGLTVPADATGIDIGRDGTVNVTTPAGNQSVGVLAMVRFPNPAGLTAEGSNLFSETEASGAAVQGTAGQEGFGELLSKYLEKSNVEMVNELVNMITAQRGYEINSRCIRVGDEILRNTNMLIR